MNDQMKAALEKAMNDFDQARELHVILDNSSSHRTPAVRAWLDAHPLVHFHYTPTSASWLNQVEGFFGILGKQSLGVTDFHSKKALRDHLNAYMRAWKKNPTPFAWTNPPRRSFGPIVECLSASRRRCTSVRARRTNAQPTSVPSSTRHSTAFHAPRVHHVGDN